MAFCPGAIAPQLRPSGGWGKLSESGGGGRRLGEGKGGWGAIVLRKQKVLLFLLPLTCGLGSTGVLLGLCFCVKTLT